MYDKIGEFMKANGSNSAISLRLQEQTGARIIYIQALSIPHARLLDQTLVATLDGPDEAPVQLELLNDYLDTFVMAMPEVTPMLEKAVNDFIERHPGLHVAIRSSTHGRSQSVTIQAANPESGMVQAEQLMVPRTLPLQARKISTWLKKHLLALQTGGAP